MAFAGGSAATLATTGTTQAEGQAVFGPCLFENMGEAALMSALNAWGSGRDRELRALREDLSATQLGVSAAFDAASAGVSATLQGIIESFRTEVGMMQQQTYLEAQQSIARLEMVVTEARARFGEQDTAT